jgi:hypothetical protein
MRRLPLEKTRDQDPDPLPILTGLCFCFANGDP